MFFCVCVKRKFFSSLLWLGDSLWTLCLWNTMFINHFKVHREVCVCMRRAVADDISGWWASVNDRDEPVWRMLFYLIFCFFNVHVVSSVIVWTCKVPFFFSPILSFILKKKVDIFFRNKNLTTWLGLECSSWLLFIYHRSRWKTLLFKSLSRYIIVHQFTFE